MTIALMPRSFAIVVTSSPRCTSVIGMVKPRRLCRRPRPRFCSPPGPSNRRHHEADEIRQSAPHDTYTDAEKNERTQTKKYSRPGVADECDHAACKPVAEFHATRRGST